MRKTRVLIAEDYVFFRDTLEALLGGLPGVEVVGKATGKGHFVEEARALFPDILIVDIRLLGSDGLDAVGEIRKELPLSQIIVIGDEGGKEYLAAARECGAAAYVVKSAMCHELVAVVDELTTNARQGIPQDSTGIAESPPEEVEGS